jgi:ribosomal protein S21
MRIANKMLKRSGGAKVTGLSLVFGGRKSFNRHCVGRTRRTLMVVRIVLAEREPNGLALRRFKKLLERQGVTWEMRRRTYFADPSSLNVNGQPL